MTITVSALSHFVTFLLQSVRYKTLRHAVVSSTVYNSIYYE